MPNNNNRSDNKISNIKNINNNQHNINKKKNYKGYNIANNHNRFWGRIGVVFMSRAPPDPPVYGYVRMGFRSRPPPDLGPPD